MITSLSGSRTCPRCGRGQIDAGNKRKETVKCKFCGHPRAPTEEGIRERSK